MTSFEWERSSDRPLPASGPSGLPTAADWIREHQDAAVERLFKLLEENQAALAALAQAWRQTRRALELTQADLTVTQNELAAERRSHRLAND
jgi:ABC-type nitrate/sulfonate/bicarbonate transport system substrate-binding protein